MMPVIEQVCELIDTTDDVFSFKVCVRAHVGLHANNRTVLGVFTRPFVLGVWQDCERFPFKPGFGSCVSEDAVGLEAFT